MEIREDLRKRILERYKDTFYPNRTYSKIEDLARDIAIEENHEIIESLIETIIEIAEDVVIDNEVP